MTFTKFKNSAKAYFSFFTNCWKIITLCESGKDEWILILHDLIIVVASILMAILSPLIALMLMITHWRYIKN